MYRLSRLSSSSLLVFCCVGLGSGWSQAGQQGAGGVVYSSAHRNSERVLPQTMTGGSKALQAKVAAARTGISLVVADFDGDGVRDLMTGYGLGDGSGAVVLQRGVAVATAPGAREQAMLAAGQFVAPYAAKAETIAVPVRPDLLQTADVSGYGHQDLLVAAKGGSVVYLLAGKGDGTFLAAQALAFSGPVSALTMWRGPEGANLLVGSVCGSAGCGLQVVDAAGKTLGFAGLPGAVSSMEIAPVNGGGVQDVVAVVGGKAVVVDGESLLGGVANVQTIMSGAVAVEAGHFTYNLHGGMQLAVLGSDATMHLFTRGALNVHQMSVEEIRAARRASHTPVAAVKTTGVAWTEVETSANFGPGTSAGAAAPVMMHGHISGNGYDDVVLLAAGQYYQWTHQATTVGDVVKTTAYVMVDSTSDPVTAATLTRVAASSQLGVVSLGGARPMIAQLPAYRTINVTGTTDSATTSLGSCTGAATPCSVTTLRSAIAVVNSDQGNSGGTTIGTSKADTINLPAGTITLTAYNGGSATDVDGDVNIHLDLDGSASIVGAGSGSTFIQTTNTSSTNEDNLFDINSGVVNTSSPSFDTYMSGLTIRNGTNLDNPYTNPSSLNYEGGLINWAGGGSDYLTLVNVVLNNGFDLWEGGGGLEAISLANGLCVVELDSSTVSNNRSVSTGGGVDVGSYMRLILNTVTVSGNEANSTQNPSYTAYLAQNGGYGGGVAAYQDTGGIADSFTGVTFTGNSSYARAGGLYEPSGVTMSGSTFTGNTTGTSGAKVEGGALVIAPANVASTVTTSTFTGNYIKAGGDGNAILIENGGNVYPFTMHYSRIYGNKPTGTQYATHTGLAVGSTGGTAAESVNATDNWWGCNAAATGTNCDTAGVQAGSTDSSSPVLTPFTTLTLVLSSTTPTSGTSFSATGSLAQDNVGTVYSQANDAAYVGVPATVSIVQNGGYSTLTNTPGATLTSIGFPQTYAGIQATATATQAGTGLATVTVDGCVITTPSATTSSTSFGACGAALPSNFTISAPDLSVSSTHSPANFKAGDTADTYTITVSNVGNATTSGTVTVTDVLPGMFTEVSAAGTNWTCNPTVNAGTTTVTCTSSQTIASSVTFPAITVTVGVPVGDIGNYNNQLTVSGGGETNTNNDTYTDATLVIGAPTITAAFSPTTVAPGAHSTLTFTIVNPNTTTALAGLGLVNNLPATLTNYGSAGGTCGGTGSAGASQESFSGATLAASSSCTFIVMVTAGSTLGTTTDTSNAVTSTTSNNGGTASATLTIGVTPTKLAYTAGPATPIAAGGSSGAITVALEDAAGNVATTNSTAVVTLTVTGPAGYTQGTAPMATVVNGVATFTALTPTIAGSYTYTASASGFTSAVATEVVNAGAVATVTVTGLPTFTAPQMSGMATVTVSDSYGNVATGFTGTVTLSSTTDTTATFSPASYTYGFADSGSHRFTVTFDAAGTQTVTATTGAVSGSETGIVVEDAIWILNTSGTLARLTDAGVQTGTDGTASGTAPIGGVAFDNAGNVWATNYNNNGYVKYSATGTQVAAASSIGGLNEPTAVFIDGLGTAWFVNAGNNAVTNLSAAGSALSPSAGYQPGALSVPTGIIVDSAGSVWITNEGSSTVTRLVGAAAPVVTPTVTGTINKTLGTRP